MTITLNQMLEQLQEIAVETGNLKPEEMVEAVNRRWHQEGVDPEAVEQMGNAILAQMLGMELPPEEAVKSAFATGFLMGLVLKRKMILP